MRQALLLVAALAAMVSIIPLSIWAATGRLRDAWEAFKGYMVCMGILAVLSLAFTIAAFIGSIP
jgi:uncharacterized membrane protein